MEFGADGHFKARHRGRKKAIVEEYANSRPPGLLVPTDVHKEIQIPTLADAVEAICALDAPMAQRLAAYAAQMREHNAPFAEAYDELVARLQAGQAGSSAPAVGDEMAPFVLPSNGGTLVTLSELTARGPVVVNFNRGHWCPFCRIQLRTIAAFADEIHAAGGQIVSIVPDRQEFAAQLRLETAGRVHVLSDMDCGYALSAGLVISLEGRLKELMHGRGHRLEIYQGSAGWFVPLPATFVVGRDGRVCARFVDPDFRKRMDIEAILAAISGAVA